MTTITYKELADRVGDMVLMNNITEVDPDIHETIEGRLDYCLEHDDNKDECNKFNGNDCELEQLEIFQYYAITSDSADYLKRKTNELVMYSDKLDTYFLGVTHYGTAWEGVYVEVSE